MADSGQNEGGSQSRVPHPTSKKSGRGRKRGKKGKAKGQGMVEATVRSHGSSTPATTDEVRTGMEAQRQRQTASVRRGDHNLQIHSDQQLGGSDQLETAQQQGGQVPGHHTTQEQHGSQQPIQQQQSEQHASQPQTPSQLEQGTRSPERGLHLGDSDSDSSSDEIGPGGSIEGDDSLPDLSDLIGANTGGIDIANNNNGDGNIEYDTQGPTDALNLDTINPDQLGPDGEPDDPNDHDSVNSHLQSLLAQDARLQADVNLGLQGGVGTNPIPRPSTHALEQTRAGQLAGGHATDANPAQLQPPLGFPPYPAQQRSVLPRGLPHPPTHSPHDAQQGIDNRNTSPSTRGLIPGSHPLPSPQPASSQFRVDAPTGMTTPVHTMHGMYPSPGSVPTGTSVGPGYTDNAWRPLNLSPSHFGASRHVPDGTDSFRQQSHVATSNAHFNAPGQGLAHTVPQPFSSGQAWGFTPRPPFNVPIQGVRPPRYPYPWAARPSQLQPPVHTPGMSVQNVDVAPLDLGVYDSIGELVTAYQSSEQSDRDMATASLTQIVEHAISARNMLQKLSSATRPSMRHMTAAVDRVTRYDDLITALKSKGCEVPDADVSFAVPAPPDTARTNASSDARTRTSSRGYSSTEIRKVTATMDFTKTRQSTADALASEVMVVSRGGKLVGLSREWSKNFDKILLHHIHDVTQRAQAPLIVTHTVDRAMNAWYGLGVGSDAGIVLLPGATAMPDNDISRVPEDAHPNHRKDISVTDQNILIGTLMSESKGLPDLTQQEQEFTVIVNHVQRNMVATNHGR